MRRENVNYFVVGLFVLAMMVVFFIMLYKIAGKTGPTDEYYVTYENVSGIKYGTPVLYEGYLIGQVEVIQPVRAEAGTNYRITLSVEKGWQIPSDSIAEIVASGLLSAITISIREGESKTGLNPGDSIQGREASNIFAAVNEVAADIHDLSENNIKPLIRNLDKHFETVVNEIRDITEEGIKPLIADANRMIDQPEIITDIKSAVNKLNMSADRLLSLLDDDNQNRINQTLTNVESASGTLNILLQDIEESRILLNKILTNVDTMVVDNKENIQLAVGDLQKSLDVVADNINAIVHHMEGSSRNIHELSRQVRENPGLILKSSAQPEEGEE